MNNSDKEVKSVLFVIYQTGIKGNGGVQSITNIIKEIAPNHNIYILTQMQTDFNVVWEQAGAKVFYRKATKFHKLNILLHNIYVFFLLLKLKINVVHCNDIQSLVCSFLGAFRKKMIFNMRAVKGPNEKYTATWAFVLKYVDQTIVLSKDMMKRVENHFPVVENKISYSYSIVDNQKFNSLKNQPSEEIEKILSLKKKIIGVVGRFEEDKQQNLFLKECVTRFDVSFKNRYHFVLIGDFNPLTNPFAEECSKIIQENGLKEFVSVLDFQKNIEDWYKMFDLTVVPSKAEGLARCMIESLACGTPVVSFDVSSAKEILEEYKCGVVVTQNDFLELKNQIQEIFKIEGLLENMAINGEEVIKSQFTIENVLRNYLNNY